MKSNNNFLQSFVILLSGNSFPGNFLNEKFNSDTNFSEHRQKQLEEQGRLSNPSFGNTLVEMERLRTAVANGAYGSKFFCRKKKNLQRTFLNFERNFHGIK